MEIYRRNDLSEIFFYQTADFPMLAETGKMSQYPNHTALSHWHDDVEFSLILSGGMRYSVNGQTFSLKPGEGIFINSRQLHSHFSSPEEDCEYLCVLLHPTLLCSSPYIERTFVAPILSNPGFPYYLLREEIPWAARVLRQLREIYGHRQEKAAALTAQSAFFALWKELYENAPLPDEMPHRSSQHLTALKDMVTYLQKHYREKVALSDIAAAGNVSKTTCCHIFETYCNLSPVAYLIEFRLRKGLELLRGTDMTVTEICYEVGFSGASYFSESFRKAFGRSPTEYRSKERKSEISL